MRSLTYEEKQLLLAFAEKLVDQEKAQLISDIDAASVNNVAGYGARILFDISGYNRPPYEGQHSIGAEGRMLDSDGAEISVCVYVDGNSRLLELEFVRWADGELISPQWLSLQIY